jgi:hypothetical protein
LLAWRNQYPSQRSTFARCISRRSPALATAVICRRCGCRLLLERSARRSGRIVRRVARRAGQPKRSVRIVCGTRSSPPRLTPVCRCATCRKPPRTPTRAPPCATTADEFPSTGTPPTSSPPTSPAPPAERHPRSAERLPPSATVAAPGGGAPDRRTTSSTTSRRAGPTPGRARRRTRSVPTVAGCPRGCCARSRTSTRS